MQRIGGLFIGVGAQEDERIATLRYAARDAAALHAAMADAADAAGGDSSSLVALLNENAMRDRVVGVLTSAIEQASNVPFDLYLAHISCHGLPSGEILLYDCTYDGESHNAVSLAAINEQLAEIRCSTLVVTLDICFGGTVVGLDGSVNRDALLKCLESLETKNSVIAWASASGEAAHESHRFRHGYLTGGLLHSLSQARARGEETIPTIRWLQEAMDLVKTEATRIGRPQSPQMISKIGPDALIPVAQVGPHQRRFAQQEGITQVMPDLDGLDSYGFTPQLINALRRKLTGSEGLNDLQCRAIAPAGLLVGRNLVVRAPTSAGKTLIAELAVLNAFRQRLKTVFLVPTRALASEHSEMFRESYGDLGLTVVRSAGDATDDDDLLAGGHFDLAVITYEKFAGLVYNDVELVDSLRLVVLDEIQLINDEERGRVPELLLALLLQRRQRGVQLQMIALIGDFADLGGLPDWLGAELVAERSRPVPLQEAVLDPHGNLTCTLRNGTPTFESQAEWLRREPINMSALREWQSREELGQALVQQLVSEGKQVLVFRTGRSAVRRMASRLSANLQAESSALLDAFDAACARHESSRTTNLLRKSLRSGVAFHSTELDDHERAFVEQSFRNRRLKVVVATTTLAAGVNLPADSVVIVDHDFFRGRGSPKPILPIPDYRNMAGRAGRAGQGMTSGESYLLAGSVQKRLELAARYLDSSDVRLNAGLQGLPPEDRTLAVAPIVRSGSLLRFVDVLGKTFWGHQHRTNAQWREQLRQETDDALEHLATLGFLSSVDGREYSLTPAGVTCALFGVSAASAHRIIETLTAMKRKGEQIGADELIALAQLTVELENAYIPIGHDETVEPWRQALGNWGRRRPTLLGSLERDWVPAPSPSTVIKRFKQTALLRSWLSARPVRDVEAAFGGGLDEPGFSYVRSIARRTSDILSGLAGLVVSQEPERQEEIHELVRQLRPALEFGLTMKAANLQRLRLGLTRKQALALAKHGIVTLEALENAVQTEREVLEGLLTTPGFHDLVANLNNRSLRRRRQAPKHADDFFSLFPDGPIT